MTTPTSNPAIISAFQSTLLHQLLIVLAVLLAIAIAWNALRGAQLRRAVAAREQRLVDDEGADRSPEPLARRILRVGFGLIWVFDGILQAQSAMPVGLANQVTGPAADGSPSWVVHLVNSGVSIWNNHPITAAVASVWIQVGIGVWLLVAPRGRWSQAGALASVGWGLVVWSFGEAFGGIFAPGVTILFHGHRAVEQLALDREVMHLRDGLTPRYAEMVYNGHWFAPERESLQALIDDTQKNVSGVARLKLFKGSVWIAGRKSPNSLYDPMIASFEEAGGYDQADAEGFIRLGALRLRALARLDERRRTH